MIIDVLQIISNFLTLKNKIMIHEMNKNTENIYIFSIYTNNVLSTKSDNICTMDQNILLQKKYSKLKILDCGNCAKLTDVNHLKNTLRVLICNNSGITDEGIAELKNLNVLYCSYNQNIHNIEHLYGSLRTLGCEGNSCGLKHICLTNMKKLQKLFCANNGQFTISGDVCNTLRVLNCSRNYGITQTDVTKLFPKLNKLICDGNPNFSKSMYTEGYVGYIAKEKCETNGYIIENLDKIIHITTNPSKNRKICYIL